MKKVEEALLKVPVKNGSRNDLWTLRRVAEVIVRVTGRPCPGGRRVVGESPRRCRLFGAAGLGIGPVAAAGPLADIPRQKVYDVGFRIIVE